MLCTLIRYSHIYKVSVSPTLNGGSAIQCFEQGNVIIIYNGTIFNFYTGHLGKITYHPIYHNACDKETGGGPRDTTIIKVYDFTVINGCLLLLFPLTTE